MRFCSVAVVERSVSHADGHARLLNPHSFGSVDVDGGRTSNVLSSQEALQCMGLLD